MMKNQFGLETLLALLFQNVMKKHIFIGAFDSIASPWETESISFFWTQHLQTYKLIPIHV